jgi:hypothetical protein
MAQCANTVDEESYVLKLISRINLFSSSDDCVIQLLFFCEVREEPKNRLLMVDHRGSVWTCSFENPVAQKQALEIDMMTEPSYLVYSAHDFFLVSYLSAIVSRIDLYDLRQKMLRASFDTEATGRVIKKALHFFSERSEMIYLVMDMREYHCKRVRFIPFPFVDAGFKLESTIALGKRNMNIRDFHLLNLKNNRIVLLRGTFLYAFNLDQILQINLASIFVVSTRKLASIERIVCRNGLVVCVSQRCLSMFKLRLSKGMVDVVLVKEEMTKYDNPRFIYAKERDHINKYDESKRFLLDSDYLLR